MSRKADKDKKKVNATPRPGPQPSQAKHAVHAQECVHNKKRAA